MNKRPKLESREVTLNVHNWVAAPADNLKLTTGSRAIYDA